MKFTTTLSQFGNNTGIEVALDDLLALGGGKRPAVLVAVNGYEYPSTVGVMGGKYLIPFSSDKRAATGLSGGDEIDVEVTLDESPRVVEPTADLAAALAVNSAAASAWQTLSPSRRKAHVTAIEGAKAEETRQRRVAAAVARIELGR
jgi:hypothetical protein